MRVALLVAAKDLRQRLRDRSILLIAVIAPLGLAFIFSRLIGSSAGFHATYAVADLDGGDMARILRQQVIGPMESAGFATVDDVATEAEARALVGNGADAAFVIPQGFSDAITGGRPTTIEVVGARDSDLATEVARSVAQRFGDGVAGIQLAIATVASLQGAPPDAAAAARIAAAAQAAAPPATLVDEAASQRQLDMTSFFSASMAIMFLFFSAQTGLVSLFDERRRGTLARILAGPVQPWMILLGKIGAAFLTAVLALTILVVATTTLIGANWGPPAGVVPLLLGVIVAAVGVSALVVSLTSNAQTAGAASSAVGITLAILGGTFSPAAQSPEIMTRIALLTPHGWFLRGLGDLHGADPAYGDALIATGVLVVIGLITGGIGLFRARRLVTVG